MKTNIKTQILSNILKVRQIIKLSNDNNYKKSNDKFIEEGKKNLKFDEKF